jgi:LDH2 family malate/lactate/ureidoglycolate dehydrogenase
MPNEVGGIRIRGRHNRFMPVAEFTTRVERLVHLMKSTPTAPGFDEVLVAGDPEWRTEAERLRDGIPVEPGNWDLLQKTAAPGCRGAGGDSDLKASTVTGLPPSEYSGST